MCKDAIHFKTIYRILAFALLKIVSV